MDLYEESCIAKNYEGYSCLTNFVKLFRFWFRLVLKQSGHPRTRFQELDTSNMTRMIKIAIDNFLELQELLNQQTNVILSEKLSSIFRDLLVTASRFIMRLFERNKRIPDVHKREQAIAQQKMEEIIHKISYVTSKPINYKRPAQHVITETYLKTAWYDMTLDKEICKMLLDCITDLNVHDHDGNTLLIVAASLLQDRNCNISCSLNLINSLIHRGAYVYAKNNEGKAVIDYVTEYVMKNEENMEGRSLLEMLKSEVPPLQTLAAKIVKTLKPFVCIPDSLKQFIMLH